MNTKRDNRVKVPKMEGAMARWYARNRGTSQQLADYRRQARELTVGLPQGARILEVAPGPGYLAIELARLGFEVSGLDISHSFVALAGQSARDAGVSVDFRQGDAARLPFADNSFDLILCQAAFKNFEHPVTALNEMHRALRPGGAVVIQDMSHDATRADIRNEVRRMQIRGFNGFFTRRALGVLRLRAASREHFRRLIADSAFRTGHVQTDGILLEVRLART
jgi:ubiquinone/menaquinone biosynthesis C-methylase UbiE